MITMLTTLEGHQKRVMADIVSVVGIDLYISLKFSVKEAGRRLVT